MVILSLEIEHESDGAYDLGSQKMGWAVPYPARSVPRFSPILRPLGTRCVAQPSLFSNSAQNRMEVALYPDGLHISYCVNDIDRLSGVIDRESLAI